MSEKEFEKGMKVTINPRNDRSRQQLVTGVIAEILTSNQSHPHGILVKLEDGEIGRVKSTKDKAKAHEQALSNGNNHTFDQSMTHDEICLLDEGPYLEFKSSALWSRFLNKEDIEKGSGDLKKYGQDTSKVIIAKTLVSFLNTDGGVLVVGIKENKVQNKNEVIGIESEYKKLKDPCADGYRRMILDFIIKPYFPSFIFNEFNKYFEIIFREIEGKYLCVMRVRKSDKKVFLSIKKEELFYIRIDASSRMIAGQDLVDYCIGRF